ncbi:NAD-P-binding protein [Dendryphion nanum]|uniref:NAD-P-binding protein n=1 Tax=Dendryphion nanum TaxID=256645 RepID=A0A9P9DDI7_9PLEO|nr:NAD-P-binding protein [Dendryphion nanum]
MTTTTNTAWGIPSNTTSIHSLTQFPTHLPTPTPNTVLIKLSAAALNYRDLLIATHSPAYPGNHKHHLVPCSDGAGTIHATHPSSIWAGQEGLPIVLHQNNWLTGDIRNIDFREILGGVEKDGTLQRFLVVGDEVVIPAPKGLSGEETASLITAGATAWGAIRAGLDGRLEGQWVLTQGTGGVSCFAIQIATALGATVIATSSSDEKLEIAKELGAAHLVNYVKTPDWDQEVLRITEGRGVDHVLEVGGAKTLLKSLNSVRFGGLVTVIGILTSADSISAELVPSLLYQGKTLRGSMGFSRDASREFVQFVDAHGIKPVVARIFAFEKAIEAFEVLEKQNAVGKLVIKISED